jgi:hypothetical protein
VFGSIQSSIVDLLEAGSRAIGKKRVPGQSFFSATPRGLLTGYPRMGFSRALNNFRMKPLGYALGGGLLFGAVATAVAPRGHFVAAGAGAAGATLGGILGATVGGLLGGLPGELLGGALGGAAGERFGEIVQPFTEFGRNQARLNFGTYKDSQAAFTMRQVAAREISQSVLNARQYLGKEALLMHS